MLNLRRCNIANDLVLPTVLFAALGGMNWAVRGTRGFGGMAGCIFAGLTWGAAWWFIARDPARKQSRRYASGWIVLAITFGICISGARGWRQWSHFFVGQLYTNFAKQEFVPISSAYGFLWLFIAGVPWAGLGACMLAWCGSKSETRVWHWMLRIACGVGVGTLARYVFDHYPQHFLPLYASLESRYKDFEANPDLKRVINDCGAALTHLGYYLGFLLFEVVRRDWKNVVLILTVGIVNGAGWAALQNWEWAPGVWQHAHFAWWRCWESSGGISIGIAYGIAYFLVNRRMSDNERAIVASRRAMAGPNFEWLLIFSGLAAFLSVFAGVLFGGRGSIGVGDLNLSPQVSLFLRNHLDSWSSIYFSIVLLFGAAYYFLYRGTTADELPAKRKWTGILANVEWGAVCLVAALIALLFAERDISQSVRDLLGRALPERIVRSLLPEGILQFRMMCVGFVIVCGTVWYLLRRKTFDEEKSRGTPTDGDPNLERLGVYLGVLAGFAVSLLNGLTGWFQTYRGYENSFARVLWHILGPVYLLGLIAILACILLRPLPRNFGGNVYPRAYGLIWLVLIFQNAIAQLVTGPLTDWNEMAFNIYYVLLFAITAVIVLHFHSMKARESR